MITRGFSLRLGAGLLLAAAAAGLRAESGPPFFTEDAGLLAPGRWEFVTGLNYARGGGARALAAPEIEISYGLAATWQLEAELELESLRPAGGPAEREFEGSFGAKWLAWTDRARGRALAVFPQLRFDTTPGLSLPRPPLVEDTGWRLPVLWGQRVGKMELSAELGYTWHDVRPGQWSAGLALEREFGDDFELGAEIYSLWSPGWSRCQLAAGLGVAVELGQKWQLLATVGRDLRNDFGPRADFRTFVGLRWSP